jgi:hypothetical protein
MFRYGLLPLRSKQPWPITMCQEIGGNMPQDYEKILAQFQEEVDAGIEAAYRQEGYVDDSGDTSDLAMKEAAFAIAMERCVVKSKAERSKKALTNGEFYSLVFPSGPGAGEDAPNLDPVGEKVLKKLSSTVWGLTQTRRSGFLQRQLESDDSTLVICRCNVYRNADPSQAVYATDNESLIMEDAVDKEIQSLVRRASSLRKDLSMIIERHPKLQGPIAKQLGVELGRIDSELALGSGDSRSRKRLEAAAAA